MALSWPSVMESRPTCWGGGSSTSVWLEKKEDSWGNTMMGVVAGGGRKRGRASDASWVAAFSGCAQRRRRRLRGRRGTRRTPGRSGYGTGGSEDTSQAQAGQGSAGAAAQSKHRARAELSQGSWRM